MSVVNDEPRRRLRAPARRALIDAAARDLFAERGYQAVSMGDIAAAAGVARSVLYDHAPSKQALFEGLLRAEHAELTARLAAEMLGDGSARARLDAAIDAFVGYVDEHPIAGRVLADEPFDNDELEDVRRTLHAQTKQALAGWLAADASGRFDPRGARERVVVDLVYGGLVEVAASRRRTPRTRRATVVAVTGEVLWGGLAPVLD